MLLTYPAVFIKEENGYSVIFPDLDYLATCGDDLNEATEMAKDCLAGYIYSLKQDGEEIVKPSNIEDINLSEVANVCEVDKSNCFVDVLTLDLDKYADEHFK